MSLSSLPLFSGRDRAPIRPQSPAERADRILEVADDLLAPLTHSHVDTGQLREFLESAFGGSDAAGAWTWKDAWDALEAAQVLHIKQIGRSLCGHSAPATLRRLEAIAARAGKGEAYDQQIGEGNKEGNAAVQAAIDGLIDQTRSIERAVTALGLDGVSIEGSDSLDSPGKVFQ